MWTKLGLKPHVRWWVFEGRGWNGRETTSNSFFHPPSHPHPSTFFIFLQRDALFWKHEIKFSIKRTCTHTIRENKILPFSETLRCMASLGKERREEGMGDYIKHIFKLTLISLHLYALVLVVRFRLLRKRERKR